MVRPVRSPCPATPADTTSSPLKPGAPSGSDVQWAFSDTGAPSHRHPVISTSYTHGRGTWPGGPATGTACSHDTLTTDPAQHDAHGRGQPELSPGTLGSPGMRLVLPVRISATDDSACAESTRATVTLLLHNHVLIARDGAQVSSA